MSSFPRSLRRALEQSAQRFGSRPSVALVDGDSMTYDVLWQRAQQVGAFLKGAGIGFGDRVALLSENMPNWVAAYFGITASGAVAVPILPDFHSSDIARILRHAEIKAVFVSRRLLTKIGELAPSETGAIVLLENWQQVIAGETDPDDGTPILDVHAAPSTVYAVPERLPVADDLASIVYTSGTTGHSKGVMLTHGNLLSDVEATMTIVSLDETDRMLSILPLPHTYESTLGMILPIVRGSSVYYMDKPPTAPVLLPALTRVRPTVMLSVPLIIEKIYKAKIQPELMKSALLRKAIGVPVLRKALHRIAGKKLLRTFGGELRLFCIDGAPLAPDVESFLREAKFPYAIGYGLTETAPLIAGTGPERTRLRSTGPALRGTTIRIQDPNPRTGEGEIMVKGPTVMKGYYRDEEKTRQVLSDDGWLSTGDLGVIDADGFIFIKGRSKNMILGPSGKNIYPEEIEAVINEFEHVRESVVYEHQKRLVALVHLDYERLQKALQSLSESDIRQKANALLADLQKEINDRVPLYARIHRIIEQAEPFQKTPTQKIKRHLYIPTALRRDHH
ncbi:MAG: AMP-binding protein [Ignavibacteriae bacterium]|nr:AMP-binding protein [Ignavibacteriota bacterium]